LSNENEAPDFLSFVLEYLSQKPGAKIMILIETSVGGFETLQNDPSFVWGFGMIKMAENVIKSRLEEVRNTDAERVMREKTERQANGLDVSKGKAN